MANESDRMILSGLDGIIDNIDVDVAETLPKRSEVFVESFLKDSKGELVTNAPVHNIMHRFIRYARKRGYNRYMILGAFGQGKSLLRGSAIMMADSSLKFVEDVVIGDLLMGDDGTSRKVLALGGGKEQAYKITLKNKDTFSCNASHKMPFYVCNRWNGYHKGDIVVMTITEYLTLPEWVRKNSLKIQKAQLDFKSQNVPFNAYIYGVWLGDGSCSGLTFTINDDDQELNDCLADWSISNDMSVNIVEQESNCTMYYFSKGTKNSKKYPELDFIKSSIIFGEKRIDKRYLINSKKVRLDILAGMIDTDGHLFDNCYEWSTKFKGLRDDFLFLCRSLGFRVSHRIKIVNEKEYYIVIVSGNTNLIPCRLKRKKATKRRQIKNPLVYGFDVEDIGEQNYYGVVLNKNKLYLQDDFTIHHNTEQMCGLRTRSYCT